MREGKTEEKSGEPCLLAAITCPGGPLCLASGFPGVHSFPVFSLKYHAGFYSVTVLALAFLVYTVLVLRSHHLYDDDKGAWLFSGILP